MTTDQGYGSIQLTSPDALVVTTPAWTLLHHPSPYLITPLPSPSPVASGGSHTCQVLDPYAGTSPWQGAHGLGPCG